MADCGIFLMEYSVYLSIAFLPHLAVRIHAEIAVTHSSLNHFHFCREDALCLSHLMFSELLYISAQNTKIECHFSLCYLLHLLRAKLFIGACFQVSYMRGVVGGGGGASAFAALQLTGCITGRVVQTVVVQHGDHFLLDQLFCQLEV